MCVCVCVCVYACVAHRHPTPHKRGLGLISEQQRLVLARLLVEECVDVVRRHLLDKVREETHRPRVDRLFVTLASVVLGAEAAGRDDLEGGEILHAVLVADLLLRVAVDRGHLQDAVEGLGELVVVSNKRLAVR